MNDWYTRMLTIGVEEDLEKYPDLEEKLGSFKKKFIKWCAAQRVNYENNIIDEFEEFQRNFINKRLYNTDVKLWKRITVQIFERDNFTCFYCGQVGGILEVDHYIPVSKNGTNDLDNLKTSCRKCNRQKKDKNPEEFALWRECNV